jgi:hypothetical protein
VDMMQQGAAKCGREAWAPMPQYRAQSCHRASPVRSGHCKTTDSQRARRQLGRDSQLSPSPSPSAQSDPRLVHRASISPRARVRVRS